MKNNQLVNRNIKTLQNSSKKGCRFLSVCYSAPAKGWHKTHYGCRLHINLVWKDPEDVCITSIQLKHTCLVEYAQRKRNYQLKDIANLSDAVAMYQPTAGREENAKQLKEIARVATSCEVGWTQAYQSSIHERFHDTIHAKIGQLQFATGPFSGL